MHWAIEEIGSLEDELEVLQFSASCANELGIVRQMCQMIPRFDEPNSPRAKIFFNGFCDEWLTLYGHEEFRQSDPLPARTIRHGALLLWSDARASEMNTEAEQKFFDVMSECGLVHGFCIPLYGPRGREAVAHYDFDRPLDAVDPVAIGSVRSLAQATHERNSMLLEMKRKAPKLSEREQEVLTWIVRGKSLASIGKILGLSSETVKTYTQRLYPKIGAYDRLTASTRALKLELARL